MKCVLCGLDCVQVDTLKKRYVDYHDVNDQYFFFKELFEPDKIEKTCEICKQTFKTCRSEKKDGLLYHYGKHQQGGALRTRTKPFSKRGKITYYSINFQQHKDFYVFTRSDLVEEFIETIYNNKEKKFKGFAEIVNQQRGGGEILEASRTWLRNTFSSTFFYDFFKQKIINEITKTIKANGLTGSSWYFKRLE